MQIAIKHRIFGVAIDRQSAAPRGSQEEIALSILAETVQLRHHAHPAPAPPNVAEAAAPSQAVDPVCGMTVEIATARYTFVYAGQTYYFCAPGCKRSFAKAPEKYLAQA